MSLVELVVGEEPLRNNAATLAESGVSGDTAVLAVLRTRSVRCVRKEEAAYSLDDVDARVVLEVPDGATEIPSWAFNGCSSIQTLTIPNSVTNIGRAAFLCCTSLTCATIPSSVTTIGRGAFKGCIS